MILVLVEHEAGTPLDSSLQAWELATRLDDTVRGVSIAPGVGSGWVIEHPLLDDYAPEAWGRALAQLVEQTQPAAVVAAGTERGNEVMAHLAATLDLPLAANAVEVEPGDPWELTRVRWGGSLLERCRLRAPVRLITAAPHTRPEGRLVEEPVESFTPDLDERAARTRVVERVVETGGITLGSAPVIVSGGRGVGSAEGFAVLEELAALVGGVVGCSRVATNNGWRPHSDQVGQTGTRVAPKLYIACGISGAIQHWVGMMAAETVLAVNLDPEAPMVQKADYAVIGDLHEVLPAVTAEIRRRG